ncbi:MAG: hypothetical protein MI923_08800 [Phycisphaerales bacterium]|nr:hypothetical protein [Phycisphaerales bacterium]
MGAIPTKGPPGPNNDTVTVPPWTVAGLGHTGHPPAGLTPVTVLMRTGTAKGNGVAGVSTTAGTALTIETDFVQPTVGTQGEDVHAGAGRGLTAIETTAHKANTTMQRRRFEFIASPLSRGGPSPSQE